jgi:hypothetical protein
MRAGHDQHDDSAQNVRRQCGVEQAGDVCNDGCDDSAGAYGGSGVEGCAVHVLLLVSQRAILELAKPEGGIYQDINVEATEIAEMAEPEMAIDATFFGFAESHEIGRVQLEIRMQVKRTSVMNLKLLGPAAHLADWMKR